MKKFKGLIIAIGCCACIISWATVYAQEKGEQPLTAQKATTDAVLKETRNVIEEKVMSEKAPTDASEMQKVNKDNLILREAIQEINAPLTGVEEIIRQEKLKMLIERINRNVSKIERIRKEQEQQLELQKQQQRILQQHNSSLHNK